MAKDKLLFRITNLKQWFPVGKKSFGKEQKYVRANDGISLDIYEGETFGLVGESGCGKSTFGRTLLQLYPQTAGRSIYYGRTIEEVAPKYVEDIFKNLKARRDESEKLKEKAKELQSQYESMQEGEEKNILLNKVNEAERDADNAMKDIAALVGGLYTAKNLEEVSQVYLKSYQAKLELKKLDQERDSAAIQAKKEEIKACDEKIKALKKANKGNPDFELYESYLDDGINLARLTEEEMRHLRRDLQLIFQDPYSSLNPRMTVGQIIGEGLLAHNIFPKNNEKMQEYVLKVMEDCGLAPYFIHRYPHQFSGGQRQRIGIARSLSVKPKFVVCDEAVSALDVSIQSQIINLLLDLKEKDNLTYLFISHDLSVIKYISDRIGVMYLGTMVELCETGELFEHPAHPYTEALLSAIPTTDLGGKKETIILEGDIPSPINLPTGCKFHTRCHYCTDICKQVVPEFKEISKGHFVACHHMR